MKSNLMNHHSNTIYVSVGHHPVKIGKHIHNKQMQTCTEKLMPLFGIQTCKISSQLDFPMNRHIVQSHNNYLTMIINHKNYLIVKLKQKVNKHRHHKPTSIANLPKEPLTLPSVEETEETEPSPIIPLVPAPQGLAPSSEVQQDDGKFICYTCDDVFTNKASLDNHMKNDHKGDKNRPGKEYIFQCPTCGNQFP